MKRLSPGRLALRVLAFLLLGALAGGIVFVIQGQYPAQLSLASAFKAKTLCAGVFIQGLDPERLAAEDSGFNPLFGLLKARIDRGRESVTCSLLGLGLFPATAVRVPGLGAVLLAGRTEAELRAMRPPARLSAAAQDPDPASLPWPRGDAEPAGPPPAGVDAAAVARAVDATFAEAPGAPPAELKRTRAVIVLVGGRIVAERYAEGIAQDTRLISWSMAKSVTSALTGILAGRGALDIREPAPVPEWSDPADPRHAITTDMLLRMSSGLSFFENYTEEPISDVNRMLFLSPDFAAYAAARPPAAAPDTVWNYSSGSTNIVSRILRRSIGDDAAYWDFPRAALFEPLGMRSAEFGVDASGTFVGSSYLYATARDFARFGLLCLRDGSWEGRRILPPGWMDYATRPTGAAPKGEYGASFWLNAGAPGDPAEREYPGMPTDLYWCDGYQGQYLFVCPSLDLVALRLGMTWKGDWGSAEFLAALRKAIGK